MAVTANFTDSENKTWDFQGANPIGSRTPGQTGQGVNGGTADAYDGGLALAVGTDLTGFGNTTLVNPFFASTDENGREFNLRPVLIGGIAVSRSFLVSDTSISSVGFCRLLDSFTNTTDQTVTIRVQILSDVGSDNATAVVEETSGNNAIDANDRGFVTDEIANQTGGDSSVGFVYGDGIGQRPVEARPSLVSGEGPDEISVVFDLTLAPGETQRLLSFAFQNTTAAQGIADLTQFDDVLVTLAARNLLAGISAAERAQIVNYAEVSVPPQGLTVTDGTGQQWFLNTANGSVSTLGTTALRSTDIAPGNRDIDTFTTVLDQSLAEAGREANLLLQSTSTALGGATTAYSLMANPEENFARLLVTITAGRAVLDLSGNPVGLFVNPGGTNLVGDRDIATGLSNGTEALTDNGLVFDDSASGLGGRQPAFSIGFGDYSFDKPVGRDDAVKFGAGQLQLSDGDLSLAAGTSQSFLYFFSLNNDAGLGLGDLGRFATPGFRELAGLSTADLAGIANFDLTEADRLQTVVLGGGDDVLIGNYRGESVNGGAGDDDLSGGGSGDILSGGQGDDVLDGEHSEDVLNGDDGDDLLLGGEGRDTLNGGVGNDTLHGGQGDDRMAGGTGNDIYRVNSAGDVIVEAAGSGTDRIVAGLSFSLLSGGMTGSEVEHLTASVSTGTQALNLTGNALFQVITGNAGANILNTGGGVADRLVGLGGNDTYRVFNAGDEIVEVAGNGGADTVQAAVDFALANDDNIEVLETIDASDATAINLTGNALSQTILGNAGANVLSDGGGAGADILRGNEGDDTYIIRNAGTTVFEATGGGTFDLVMAGVTYVLTQNQRIEAMSTLSAAGTEAIDLTGNSRSQAITGNAGANRLNGNEGNDTLTGGAGADTLTGGAGGDTFVFTGALGAGNIDRVIDYEPGVDRMQLDSAFFTGLPAGQLDGTAFVSNLTGLATDPLHRIVYESDTGNLFFDADGSGSGGRVRFAILDQNLALLAGDFLVI